MNELAGLAEGRLRNYLAAVLHLCAEERSEAVSLILFGSAANSSFSATVSDVDLIVVLADAATPEQRRRLANRVTILEVAHGFRETPAAQGALARFVERLTAQDRSCFVCTRDGLLSGSIRRMLSLSRAQAAFVDRIVLPGILSSATTAAGEELLGKIKLPPIRRFDVFKAFFSLFCNTATSAILFPLLPAATKYAMAALKHSVHSCYFCYYRKVAPLGEEVAHFQGRISRSSPLVKLMQLRASYQPSFAFVVRCLGMIFRLHLRTALDWRQRGYSPPAAF